MKPMTVNLGLDQEALDRDLTIFRELADAGQIEAAQTKLDDIVADLGRYVVQLP